MSVSYLITLYNKQDFIGGVLDAALAEQAQTGGEIVVYDDVSTDRSPLIVEERIKGNPAVRLVRGDKNRGVGAATNRLIEMAAHPYSRLIDGDDVLVKGSTAGMLRHLKANNLGFIHGMTTEIGNEPPGLESQSYADCFTLTDPVRRILRHTVAGASPSLFVTSVLKEAAPVPEWIRSTQDFLITLRVANKGVPMGYVEDIVSIGPSNRTAGNMSAALASMFGEMSRDVAHEGMDLPLADLRYATHRYAARAAKYFRRRGQAKLSAREKFALWRWQNFSWLAPRKSCIARLTDVADWFTRDRGVLVTGPSFLPPRGGGKRHRFPRRWLMLRLTDALIARTPAPQSKKGVLILRMFGIGDALLFRAVLEKYAEVLNVPLSGITILGSTAWQPAADLFFRGVKIEFIDEKRFARSYFYRMRVMRDLRARGFKTAVCSMRLRYPHVIESLMLASGADECIVAEARPNVKFDAMFAHYAPRMTRVIAQPETEKPRAGDGQPLPLMHEISHQLAFLSVVAGRAIMLEKLPALKLKSPSPLEGEEAKTWACSSKPLVFAGGGSSLLSPPTPTPPPQGGRGLSGMPYAILNIGASHAPRRWPLAYFFDIARRLLEQGKTVIFLGGPAEAGLKREIEAFARAQGARARIFIHIGDLDLAGAAELIGGASLVLSNDSGLGHLAIMLGRPAVLIVGGGHFGAFMPYPPALAPANVRFLYHLMPCYHCNWNCTMMPPGGATFPCVSEVTAGQAWQAITDILVNSIATSSA